MTSVIEKLWDNNSDIENSRPDKTSERMEMLAHLEKLREELLSILSENQIKAFKNFEEHYAKTTALSEREIFVYAFKLGARMELEVVEK